MSKAAEAFRTIGEVAENLDVPKHVLRFWEGKFPQIKPMKRGGGRRYYRPEDMELLIGIRHLLHAEGYTIKGVQKILREHGVEQVKAASRAAIAAAANDGLAKKRGRKPASDMASGKVLGNIGREKERDDVVAAVIVELQRIRGLLTGDDAAEVASGEQKRQRAVRG